VEEAGASMNHPLENARSLCSAERYTEEEGELFVCLLAPRDEYEPEDLRGAWCLICRRCWNRILDAEARRKEWEI
jgi:hypothetical protein